MLCFFGDKIIYWWQRRKGKDAPKTISLAPNPTRENIERVIFESSPINDWNQRRDTLRSVVSYKRDMNLRFEIKYIDEGVQCKNFKEPWATRHLHQSATAYWCNLYYGSTLVEKFILVSVDEGRAMLPIPKIGPKDTRPNQVLPLDYKVAQIHDTLGMLEEYMTRSRLSVYKETN